MTPAFRTPMSDDQAAAWLRANPNVEQASLTDPFEATAQTVRYMCRLIRHSLSDPIVWDAARDAQSRFGAMDSIPSQVWLWAKYSIKFVHHQKLLEKWLNKHDELQLLISPEALLKMERPKGDCAVFTTLICALLDCLDVPWEIVTVAVDPRQPGIFSHVYPRAILDDGRRMPLDASHGRYPGWEVSRQRVSAIQIWDRDGRAIQDQSKGTFEGLHGLGGCCMRGYGLGDTTMNPDGSIVDTTTGQVLNPGGAQESQQFFQDATASPGFDWASAISGDINQGLNLIGKIVAPTTTLVRGPNGQLMLTTPSSATAAASLLATGTQPATASSYMPLLLIVGAGALLLFAMKK